MARGGARRGGLMSAAAALVAMSSAASCILKTDVVPAAFNGGALDSAADPYRDEADQRRSIVTRLVISELEDAYFAPSGAVHDPQTRGYSVDRWASKAAERAAEFAGIVRCLAEDRPGTCGSERVSPAAVTSQQSQAPALASGWTDEWTDAAAKEPLCSAPGTPSHNAYARLLDEVRFSQAVGRAAVAVSEKLAERIVENADVETGARQAFATVATHLRQRRWAREFAAPTTGLVIKGGSANGIFSAGAVWTVLNLIDGCMNNAAGGPCKKDVRYDFKLVSGTSTGAMVAVAVDRFNAAVTVEERRLAMLKLVRWFTCFSVNDLYCVDSRAITALIGSDDDAQHGVLQFDGIEKVMNSCVTETMFTNRSELLLNTVDFRSGRLFSLSDQTELYRPGDQDARACLVQAALASALLPVIGRPVQRLPAMPDRPFDDKRRSATEPAYLDGGIRSEIPLLPLARRGAERVLVVSSSGSVLNETKRLRNAAALAARYIDVNTGALSEVELAHAQRHAESVRLEEINACHRALAADRRLCPAASGCDADAFCSGAVLHDEVAWAKACKVRPDPGDPPPPPGGGPGVDVEAGQEALTRTVAERVEPFWRVQGIFRPEGKVEGLNGYDFDPPELDRLFRAGADAARQRCVDIAKLLGLVDRRGAEDRATRARLVAWCSPSVPKAELLCVDPATKQPLHGEASAELRHCGQPPPSYLDDCRSPGAAPSSDTAPPCGRAREAR
jgi:predicted acylesterase/phospholipase RssA